jgi:PAS domain-containing protein
MLSTPRISETTALNTMPPADLVGGLYAALDDPPRWTAFLAELSHWLGLGACALLVRSRLQGQPGTEDCLRAFPSGPVAGHPAVPDSLYGPLELLPAGCPVPPARARALAVWLSRQELMPGMPTAVWVVENQPGLLALLMVAGLDGQPLRASHQIQELLPHLRRVVNLDRRVQQRDRRATGLEELVGRSGLGIAFLDAGGRVTWINQRASRVLATGHGIRLVAGRLCFTDLHTQFRFDTALAGRGRPASGLLLRVHRNDGVPDLRLTLHRLRRQTDPHGHAWALMGIE